MNKDFINRFLLIGDKLMPKMHLWNLKNIKLKVKKYSACGPFTRHKQIIDQFMMRLVFNMILLITSIKIL